MKMNVPEFFIAFLKKNGVNNISLIPGGGLMEVLDTAYDDKDMRIILVRHEQAAAFIAHGQARATGKPAVCMATKSPGASNLVNGVTAAFIESSPVIAISGDVRSDFKGRECFEEVDLVSLFKPITKWSSSVPTPERIPEFLREAFRIAQSGRPGPVHLSIPADFFKKTIEVSEREIQDMSGYFCAYDHRPNENSIKNAARVLTEAKRPMILAGGGVIQSGASKEVVELAEMLSMPIAVTYRKKPVTEDYPLYVSHTGVTGTKMSSSVFQWADTVLAIGCRFSEFATDTYGMNFEGKKLIHIDIDPKLIGKIYPADVGVVSDAKSAVSELIETIKDKNGSEPVNTANIPFIKSAIDDWKSFLSNRDFDARPLTHARLIRDLRESTEKDAFIVLDSGNFSSWTTWFYTIYVPGTFIFPTSGSMGFGMPGALGVKLAYPDRQVISLSGDGGFAMTMQELETASRENIKILSIVVNNFKLSNIKVRQKYKYAERYIGVDFDKPQDFSAVAKALNCYGERVTNPEELKPAIERCMQNLPAVLDVMLDPDDTNTSQSAESWSKK